MDTITTSFLILSTNQIHSTPDQYAHLIPQQTFISLWKFTSSSFEPFYIQVCWYVTYTSQRCIIILFDRLVFRLHESLQ